MSWRGEMRGWWALLVLLPVVWWSGRLLQGLLPAVQASQDPIGDRFGWLVPAVGGVLLLGFLAAALARALGAAHLRTLLTGGQACLIGALITALVWVAWTGLIWSIISESGPAVLIWNLIAGASFILCILIWLGLAVRAAASVQPLQTGAMLLAAALGLAACAYTGLLWLIETLPGPQPDLNILLVLLLVLLALATYLIPPALATAGAAALFEGLRQRRSASSGRGDRPAEPPQA